MRQYLRRVIVTLQGQSTTLKVTDLKIGFEIEKHVDSSANSAMIWIYNLSKANRNKINKEFERIRVEAGYEGHLGQKGNVGIIFDGQISDVLHKRDETDIVSIIEAGDGDKGLRLGTISRAFKKRTKPKEMIEAIQKEMPDVAMGELRDVDKLPETDSEVVMCGTCKRELDKLGRTYGFLWSVQDGALEVCPKNKSFDDVIVISAATGMIGQPSVSDRGLEVKTLLNPHLRIHRQVEVRSEFLEMNEMPRRYRISGLVFVGDNGIGGNPGDFLAEVLAEDPQSEAASGTAQDDKALEFMTGPKQGN